MKKYLVAYSISLQETLQRRSTLLMDRLGGFAVVLDSGDYPRCQAMALARAEWADFPERQKAARGQGRHRGIGVANFVKGTGRGPFESVRVRIGAESGMPELESAWFDLARAGSFEQLGSYLERRMAAGLLRPMPDSEVAARIVTESLSWFGWHRHEGRDSALYKDETVRRTVVEFICAALVPEARAAEKD